MSGDAMRALEEELGAAPPSALARLEDEQLRHVLQLIREERQRQTAALQEAGEHALRHIPRVLRGPIRRIAG